MFIVPRRGFAVLTTLTILGLTMLLSACAQTPVSSSAAAQRACPVGSVQVYSASGSARNAETTGCQSPSQIEAQMSWLGR
jgi:hypothetical protein